MRGPAPRRPVARRRPRDLHGRRPPRALDRPPPGIAPPTEADSEIAARLAPRGLQATIDDVGVVAVHTDEAEKMIAALARRTGKLAERIAEAEGDDPASCKQATM